MPISYNKLFYNQDIVFNNSLLGHLNDNQYRK